MEHAYQKNALMTTIEELISPGGLCYRSRLVWAGDYADVEENVEANLYTIANQANEVIVKSKSNEYYRYVVNHSTRQYVDKQRIEPNGYGDRIHPLPLLVSEGNGRGGGDYRGTNEELCGLWSRDSISMEKEVPEQYEEVICDFN